MHIARCDHAARYWAAAQPRYVIAKPAYMPHVLHTVGCQLPLRIPPMFVFARICCSPLSLHGFDLRRLIVMHNVMHTVCCVAVGSATQRLQDQCNINGCAATQHSLPTSPCVHACQDFVSCGLCSVSSVALAGPAICIMHHVT
jgi:hypothetical protein